VVVEAKSHLGSKAAKTCFMSDENHLITTGFSQQAERQVFVWDLRSMEKPKEQICLDQGTGSLFPWVDLDSQLLFLWGKGDGNVRFYEMEGGNLHYINDHRTTVPQKGLAFLPKRSVNVGAHELLRAVKLEVNAVQPIAFVVPRKSDQFQDDLYPECTSGVAGLEGEAWIEGADGECPRMSMKPGEEGTTSGAPAKPKPVPMKQQLEAANKRIAELEEEGKAQAEMAGLSQAALVKARERIEQLEKRLGEMEAMPVSPDESMGVSPPAASAYPQ